MKQQAQNNYTAISTRAQNCFLELHKNTAMGLLLIRGGVAKGLKARGGGFVRLPRAAEYKGRQKEYFE